MSSSIFHDYDIRGRYPEELNEAVFYRLGEAFFQVFKPKKVAIGRDGRLSSDTLFLYLAWCLKEKKVKVLDLGRISTPFGYWYSQKYNVPVLVVTASHNPVAENGLKIFTPKLGPVDKMSGLSKIQLKFEKLEPSYGTVHAKEAIFEKIDVASEYQKFILSFAKKVSPKLKLAIDFSNGVMSAEAAPILEKLKIGLATLNEKIDGRFPGHSPNPLDASSQNSLKVLMKTKKFDLGAIVDGDGDRILFFDEKGEAIDSSYIVSLLIGYYSAKKVSNLAVVRTVSMSRIIDETAAAEKAKVWVTKVGRSHVCRMVKKKKAILGAEKSGHFFFKEYYGGDSSLLALIFALDILSRAKKPISEIIKPYQKYVIFPELNIPFQGQSDYILGLLKEKFKEGQQNWLDGLRVDFPEWGFSIRKSNTEKVWRLTLEGVDKEELAKHRREIEETLTNPA